MKQVKNISLAILAGLLMAGCSNEEDPVTPIDDTKVELGITAGVALTKSAITGGDGNQSGTAPDVLQSIAVYAAAAGYTVDNYGLYSQFDGTWTSGTDKIYLSSEVATIYAYHPAYTPDATNHAMATTTDAPLTITGLSSNTAVTDAATIPVSVFLGGGDSDALRTNSTITVPSGYNATAGKILSAPGEVDYMWAENASNTDKFTANNGNNGGPGASVALNMKHALSMVSFRVYNDGHYNKEGKLTKIELKNERGKILNDGGLASSNKPTMKIATGEITVSNSDGDLVAATYTRLITTEGSGSGYTLPKQGEGSYSAGDAAKDAAAVFSILVLPDASEVAKNNIQVTFTIDGEDFEVKLAANETGVQWEPGKNNIYTAKLSGKSLTLSSVTVEAWDKVDNNLGTVD